jgi:GT2 family glycosyltransferase
MSRPVHAIVVAYHGADALDRALAALAGSVLVTVVDNSSSPAVYDVALRHGAAYRDAGANLGFGSGVNVALREILSGPPQDVLLLNPDAAIEPSAIRRLADDLHAPGKVAAVAPRLVGPDGANQRVVWPFPTPLRGWLEAVGRGRLPSADRFLIGAVVLLRWEALVEVGEFDERFFLYAEEVDWQRRARAFGWTSRQCAGAVAVHDGGGSSGDPALREALFHAAHETYLRKWYGAPGWWLYRGAACAGATTRTLVLRGERRAEAGRRALLYLRGPRRRAEALRR